MTTENENIKNKVDELNTSLSADESTAIERIEEQKGQLQTLLEKAREIADDGAHAAKIKLDELRVQLALGKMETRDSLENQREKIGSAMHSAREALSDLGEKADDRWQGVSKELGEQWDKLQPKIEGLRLQWALGSAYAKDELGYKKEQLTEKLNEWKGKLQDEHHPVRESIDKIGEDLKDAGSEFVTGLKALFGVKDDEK